MKKIKFGLVLSLITILVFNSFAGSVCAADKKWNTVATMQESHLKGQTVTLNGKIYILGGCSLESGETSVMEEYDPVTGECSEKAPMSIIRSSFIAKAVDGKIYAIGGLGDKSNTIEMYDPALDKWTTKASKTCKAQESESVVLNGKIYVLGGHYNGVNTSAVECYDPATDTWTTKKSMPFSLYQFGIAVYDGKIYVVGGRTKYNTQNDYTYSVEEYDPAKDLWSTKASIPSSYPAYQHMTVINNKIYNFDGQTMYEYNFANNVWTKKASLPEFRWEFNTAVLDNQLYILGGYHDGSSVCMSTNAVYDYQTNTFNSVPSMNQSRSYLLTESLNGSIYVIGGCNEKYLNTIESYKVINNPSLTVKASSNKVKVNQKFTTTVAIHNGTNICAEDIKITYDPELFEYDGVQSKAGQKVYKEDKTTSGTVRLIVACQGKDNAATGDKDLLDLIFKAKKAGTGKVDIVRGRIADNATLEEDLLNEDCGEDTIVIEEAKDVNRSGEYTLLDLGIDAWYDGMDASDVDSTKYNADIVADGKIDDNDLTEITNQILANSNYIPNQY